jgi:sirohydrochlorin cobaltochelatase
VFDTESIREVYVVPNFISEGYFTHTVVPRELELNGRITKRLNGQIWKYCEPVGNHPLMTELLLKRAHEVAPDAAPAESSLLIVAHGTDLNENSAVAAKREAEKIRALGKYAAVLNVYMEEAPLVADWRKLTETPNVIAVPFFISDGLHSYEDIPRLLGIKERRLPSRRSKEGRSPDRPGGLEAAAPCGRLGSRPSLKEIFRQNPYAIDGRNLFYAPSIGTDPGIADIIIEQANAAAKS